MRFTCEVPPAWLANEPRYHSSACPARGAHFPFLTWLIGPTMRVIAWAKRGWASFVITTPIAPPKAGGSVDVAADRPS